MATGATWPVVVAIIISPHLVCGRAETVYLAGSGASFPVQVYSKWGSGYEFARGDYVTVEFSYQRGSSHLGKMDMKKPNPPGAFGASEVDYSAAEKVAYPDLALLPVIIGGVVLVFNIPGVPELTLSRENVVGIYDGSLMHWNSPAIAAHNPGTWLPPENIVPIARADYSGTTQLFTRTLSAISPAWNSTYGTFSEGLIDIAGEEETPVHWNDSVVKYYGRTNRGMTGLIYSYRYSIGYISIGEATTVNTTYARIINKANNTVGVTVQAMVDVMEDAISNVSPAAFDFPVLKLEDSDLPQAYPFIGASYLIVDMVSMADCDQARELYMFIDWLLEDSVAREIANELVYSLMIPEVKDYVMNTLDPMVCEGNKLVTEAVRNQRDHEKWLKNYPLRIGLSVGLTLGILLLVGFIAYIIIQQVRLRKALKAEDWNIRENYIDIKWDREKGWAYMPSSRFSEFGSGTSGLQSIVSEGASQTWSLLVVKYGKWNDKMVCMRRFPTPNFRVSKESAKMAVLHMSSKIIHTNVLRFYGVTEMDGQLYLVSEHAEKGCLTDVLQNSRYKLDDNFKYALALDVAQGMDFLHNNQIIHGNLTSECCLLDGRWNVKVTQWEILKLYSTERERKLSRVHPGYTEDTEDKNVRARSDLWTAPEILQGLFREPSKRSDVYSFSILLVEIFSREDPYTEHFDHLENTEIVKAIIKDGLRPDLSGITNKKIKSVITSAWQQDATKRPNFNHVVRELKHRKTSRKSVIESMMDTLEEYVSNLEEKVQDRTVELAEVNKNLQNLLHQILPPSVALSLSQGENVQPEHFNSATIFFSDIVGFTKLCAQSQPMEVVTLLNDLYTAFDSVIDKLDVYKVETIGDAYMCISGVPNRNGIRHAGHIATMALRLVEEVKTFRIRHRPWEERLQLRAGVHTGSVVAGVAGVKMPRYCIFGDTVNTASRMESTSEAMQVQVSGATHSLLEQLGGYSSLPRGSIPIKGKGEMTTYFLLSYTPPSK